MAGRPSSYTPEVANEVCERLAAGESLRSICNDSHIPHISTVLLWVVDGKHETFSEQYARAREAQGHYWGDSMGRLHDEVRRGELDAQQAKVIQDGLKWMAERMARKQYGQKQEVEHTGRVTVSDDAMDPAEWAKQYTQPGESDELH